ncbi:MAG: WD40 repeat domain-containing protein [Ignavibacteriaceae bacterium]|nr:WD40 repeat domain-containing protein [Ignavibacteriaceae bacterium]
MKFAILILLFLFSHTTYSQNSDDLIFQSYLAHISAANSSLRLNEKAEAKRWIENAPQKFRGWEWNYLNNRIDWSSLTFNTGEITPTKISYSNNGNYFAFGDLNGTIHIHDAKNLNELKRFDGHLNTVYSAKFIQNDSKLISCSRDTTIRVWDFYTGKELWQTKTGGRGLADVDVSPDGKLIVFCSWYINQKGISGFIQLYDLEKREKIWQTEHNTHPLVVIKFSPDGKKFAVGSWEWQVSVWDLNDLSKPKIFDFNDVQTYSAIDDIAFSPDSKKIAAATKNTTPRIWDIDSGKLEFELQGHQKPVYAITYSKDGSKIYTSGDDAVIMIWDASTGKRLNKIFGHEDKVHSMTVSPNGNELLTASRDNTIRKWRTENGSGFLNAKGRNQISTYA